MSEVNKKKKRSLLKALIVVLWLSPQPVVETSVDVQARIEMSVKL